jgi:hypothetical protein
MSSGPLYHVALVRTDVSENMSPPFFRVSQVDTIPQLCYRGILVEAVCSPKRRLYLEPLGAKSQKISVIDTAVKTAQKTEFFDPTYYPSMERLIDNDSTVTQLWKHHPEEP